jgi:septal ring factor EnvC (AmiA/AmiB activator)
MGIRGIFDKVADEMKALQSERDQLRAELTEAKELLDEVRPYIDIYLGNVSDATTHEVADADLAADILAHIDRFRNKT